MYRLTCTLFAFLSVALPAIATPMPAEEAKRTTNVGRGTWYNPGLGNCGGTNSNSDYVVAISKARYDSNNGANCWQISSGGKSVSANICDSCDSCGEDDLDMSPAVFQQLAPLSEGVIEISWEIV
ncbi:expansin family protein [Russula compacta]|nr:expansin family protein [Russula compacta]